MNKLIVAFALSAAVLSPALAADEAASAPNAQRNRMKTCNAEAGDRKGDERQAYMKQCLSAKPAMSQQDKMKSCNQQAGDKKGDERKAFMKGCLSS